MHNGCLYNSKNCIKYAFTYARVNEMNKNYDLQDTCYCIMKTFPALGLVGCAGRRQK